MSASDASAFEGHEELVAELRANQPVATDRLRQQVLELAPGSRPRMSRRRRLVFVVVPVAVALAVGAALVHGFVSSGSHRFHAGNGLNAAAPAYLAPLRRESPSAQKAAHGSPLYGSEATSDQALRGTVVIPKNRLVHADASLQVQVRSHAVLTHATNMATQSVSSLGGYAQSVHYQSSRNGDGNAFLALRVPVGKAETAIGKLGALGRLVSQQVSTKDLQQQLAHENNGIGSLRRAIAVYEQALKSGTLTAAERVQIQIRLSNARHSLTQL